MPSGAVGPWRWRWVRRDPGTIHQEGSQGSQAGGVRTGPVLKSDGGEARSPDGRNQGRSRAAKAVGGTPGIGPATEGGHGMSLVPPKRPFREGMSDQRYGRTLGKRTVAAVTIDAGPQEGAAMEESVMVGNGLYLPGRIEGNGVSFLVDRGSGVSILAAPTWRKWGRAEDELTRYWGRRCEGAVYLPDLAGTRKEHMSQCLPCTIRSVTEVRAVTEENLAVRAVGSATLAPHTVTQVRVIVPTPRARGTVMIEPGPGPLGLCPVRGIVEVEQDSSIWLANTGTQPIHIEKDEVVAMAECVLAEP